ncbi:MAG: alpha/beta hydrolase [Prevotella sp.]
MWKLKLIVLSVLAFFATTVVRANNFEEDFGGGRRIDLWSVDNMPNSRNMMLKDSVINHRTWQIGVPRIYAFMPCSDNHTKTAVILIPGGGYAKQAYEAAGITMAQWLNSIGITAFVLLHRLPTSPDIVEPALAPMQDAQRAMRYVRAHAAEYGVEKIGVMGCSAGGHVSACVSTVRTDVSAVGDSLDRYSFRPDFSILISPVITMRQELTNKGSRKALLGDNPDDEMVDKYSMERHVTTDNPPTLLIHASDDTSVSPMNSVMMYSALIEKGVNLSSIHIFPFGKHAIAMRRQPGTTALWPEIAEGWMREIGVLP